MVSLCTCGPIKFIKFTIFDDAIILVRKICVNEFHEFRANRISKKPASPPYERGRGKRLLIFRKALNIIFLKFLWFRRRIPDFVRIADR
jgi:hypothetical protein